MKTYVKGTSLSNSPKPLEDGAGELMGCIIDIENPHNFRYKSEKVEK